MIKQAQRKDNCPPEILAAKEERIKNYQVQVRGDLRSKNTIEFIPDDDRLYRVQLNFVELYSKFAD